MFTKKEVLSMLQYSGLRLRKSFGQNFMVDRNMVDKILSVAAPDKTCAALEVGPGVGSLTLPLAARAGAVRCYEIDRRLEPVLGHNLLDRANVRVFWGDVMKQDLAAHCRELRGEGFDRIQVVSNLPYGISTPFILWVLLDLEEISSLTLTVQKEVAERFCSRPGDPDYGFASLAAGLKARIRREAVIHPNCFFPVPRVTSALVRFDRVPRVLDAAEEKNLLALAKILFTERRKTIKTVLSRRGLLPAGIGTASVFPVPDLGRRPETFGTEEFLALSRALTAAGVEIR